MALNSTQDGSVSLPNSFFTSGKSPKETRANPDHPIVMKNSNEGFPYYYAFDMGSNEQLDAYNNLLLAIIPLGLETYYRSFVEAKDGGSVVYLFLRKPVPRSYRNKMGTQSRIRKTLITQ